MYSKLLIARKEKRVTHAHMAKVLNIAVGTYYRKENKINDFTLKEAIALAKYFNRTLDDLFAD